MPSAAQKISKIIAKRSRKRFHLIQSVWFTRTVKRGIVGRAAKNLSGPPLNHSPKPISRARSLKSTFRENLDAAYGAGTQQMTRERSASEKKNFILGKEDPENHHKKAKKTRKNTTPLLNKILGVDHPSPAPHTRFKSISKYPHPSHPVPLDCEIWKMYPKKVKTLFRADF
jgi:hypothetical protein